MCAISGLFARNGYLVEAGLLEGISHTMRRRGPDGHGFHSWGNCALAHERLAIIDVTGGKQPLLNEDGSCGVVVNGEIYNYQELRHQLLQRGHQFRTQSDSEVVLHGYEEFGCSIFGRLDGMFAVALWDGRQQQLVLARDGLGKKPLAFCWYDEDTLGFASDIRALRAHPDFDSSLRVSGLGEYLQHRCVTDPQSIFTHVHKVPPGEWICFRSSGEVLQGRHWQLPAADPQVTDYEEAKRELRRLLQGAVQKRLMSEVPLGVLLSSGIDSSIVAAEAAYLQKKIFTFTLGFAGQSDERPVARETAAFLGTTHQEEEIALNPEEDLGLAEALFDEPFADSSAVATAKICRVARQRVTVVLNGDGGR